MRERAISLSKQLSFVLRHDPASVGLVLDAAGWVDVELLLGALARHGTLLSREELEQVVQGSDKRRFALSADGTLIRANQGHSVQVELGYETAAPPATLFHGTVERALPSILARGLLKGERHHVHLSVEREQAVIVAKRRGAPIVLEIDALGMAQQGHEFFCSANGVWLTEHVPARFLSRGSGTC